MNITEEKINDFLIANIEGRIDTTQSEIFEQKIMEIINAGHSKIILNCEKLDYISSAGMRIFLLMQKKAKNLIQIKICNLQPIIKELFDMSGFAAILSIEPDLESALNS